MYRRCTSVIVAAGLVAASSACRGTTATVLAQAPPAVPTIAFTRFEAAAGLQTWLKPQAQVSFWHASGKVEDILEAIWTGTQGRLDFPVDGGARTAAFTLTPVAIDPRTQLVPCGDSSKNRCRAFRGVSEADPHDTVRIVYDPLTGMHIAAFIGDELYYHQPKPDGSLDDFILYAWHDVVPSGTPCAARGRPGLDNPPWIFTLPPGKSNDQMTLPARRLKTGLLLNPDFVVVANMNPAKATANAYRALEFASQIFERELGIELVPVMTVDLVDAGASCQSGSPEDRIACADKLIMAKLEDIDLGHMLAGGPVKISQAEIKTACGTCRACAMTTFEGPVLAPSIDTLVHEIAHQLGAHHSFNGNNANRDSLGGFEPALGSTVMSYAQVSSPGSVQDYRDQYFHAGSINEMFTSLPRCDPGVKTCGCAQNTAAATPPVTLVSTDRLIALRKTAFRLHADVTTTGKYRARWEEIDRGTAQDSVPPFYRSHVLSAQDTTFPSWDKLWTNAFREGDRLFETCTAGANCRLRFQLTSRAKDRRVVSMHTTTVEIAAAGPFRVSATADVNGVKVTWTIDGAAGGLPAGFQPNVKVKAGTGPGENEWEEVGTGSVVPAQTTPMVVHPHFAAGTRVRVLVEAVDGSYLALSDWITLK